MINHPTVCAIAHAHQKSPAQSVLHGLVQRDILPLIKSSKPQQMFALTEAEMQEIYTPDKGRTCFNTGEVVHDFLTQAAAEIAPSAIIKK